MECYREGLQEKQDGILTEQNLLLMHDRTNNLTLIEIEHLLANEYMEKMKWFEASILYQSIIEVFYFYFLGFVYYYFKFKT